MATSPKAPAKPAGKPADAVEPSKKSNKLLIILVAGVLLLILGGAGAAVLFLTKAKNAGGAEQEHASAQEASKTPVFVNIEPFVVNLQQETGDQFLQVSITLQVQNESTAEAIKLFTPLVRNRLLLSLSSKKASELLTAEGKKKLTEEIITQLNAPFSPNSKPQQVSDVFYTSFVIQQQ